ncbi:LCP family protein required for cell wall assembly [Lachnospiraceae bacterium PF1-21]|uniref:LCP family protein n=1 Tax=Ohessyouella blattaphilus TaxID=2949333 RepID=UPI003E21C9D1
MSRREGRATEEELIRKMRVRKKRRRRAVFLVLEVLVLAVLGVIAYGMMKLEKVDQVVINEENLEIYKDTGEYTNIALFGLDSRAGELDGGVQSDAIMVASINNETYDVKVISVYRDTLLQQSDGSYEKANSAYNYGGPEAAIAVLNRNFDLDIQNYVSVNFEALVDVIDALGGLDIYMTEEEAIYCMGYAAETALVTGYEQTPIQPIEGVQHVDGINAVAYTRIRYTDGNDFKRTERQRFILNEVVQKAKGANIFTLNNIVDKVFPKISTSFSAKDMIGYAANVMKFNIAETSGFPYDVMTSEMVMNHVGSYVVPVGLTQNVRRLHQSLFGNEEYQPSENVILANDEIGYLTGIYEGYDTIDTNFERNATDETTQ